MKHKKIALFISHIYGEYQQALSQGIIDKALEFGYQTEVYATNDGENLGNFSVIEDCILRLPAYSNLDGIIFASGTYANPELREDLREKLKALDGVPVLEVADTSYSFPHIALENNITAGMLAEHMITVHGARRLCYFGDALAPEISAIRQKAFADALERNHITPDPDGDFYDFRFTGDMEQFRDVLSFFTKNGTDIPDAVICYNDHQAMGLWRAAIEAGIRIPEDMAITGCDHLEAGQNLLPPLTTVSYPIYELGNASVDGLLTLIKGKEYQTTTIFAEPIYGGSCGCSYRKDRHIHDYSHSLEMRIFDLERSILTSARMSSAFSHAMELEDGLEYIADFATQIENCSGFYLCLTEGWDSLSGRTMQLTEAPQAPRTDTGRMDLLLALRNGKRLPACTFRGETLLPDFLMSDAENARIVSPIYYHRDSYGYIVMTFEDNHLHYPFQLIQWLVNISQLLYNLRNRKNTEALSERLEEIYMHDPLTSLLNKNGYDYYRTRFLEKLPEGTPVSVLFLDMNKLKAVNDQYGHSEGDFAIEVLGQAIRQACEGPELTARIGGDEFVIYLAGNEEKAESFLNRIQKYLDNYNRLSAKEYSITASYGRASGICTSDAELDELIDRADADMYIQKKKSHEQA